MGDPADGNEIDAGGRNRPDGVLGDAARGLGRCPAGDHGDRLVQEIRTHIV